MCLGTYMQPQANGNEALWLAKFQLRINWRATEVVSDEWRVYAGIPNLLGSYQHMTINHSQNFINPVTVKHTNHVESYWMRAKQRSENG